MKQFPLFLNPAAIRIVIIGGGEEAQRKARLFCAAGATPEIIAPTFDAGLIEEFSGSATLTKREAEASDFDDARIVVIADASPDEARRLYDIAHGAGALVNVVDQPALCDFTTPSIIDRGEIVIAISTNGAAPVLGQKLRGQIEAIAPPRLGDLAALARDFRDSVKAKISPAARRAFWRRALDGEVGAKALAGDITGAREAMIASLNTNNPDTDRPKGVVHIVGAGPGDPDLLTLRAHRLLQEADVIFYDRLVTDEILSLARRDATRIFVGKAKSNHAVPQEEIEAQLIAAAKEGKVVVRLKGGDPFVFGRGGEELATVRAAGIEAFVTPGVTAATGCAAATGIPLTHRDHAHAVTFVTGHGKGGRDIDTDWRALAALGQTLVIYMGASKAGEIAGALISAGRDPDTPAAFIENGARASQRAFRTTLHDLGDAVDAVAPSGPTLLVIGEVAALGDAALFNIIETHQPERLSA